MNSRRDHEGNHEQCEYFYFSFLFIPLPPVEEKKTTEMTPRGEGPFNRDPLTGLPYYDSKNKKFLFGVSHGFIAFKALEETENLRELVENHLLEKPFEPLDFYVQILDNSKPEKNTTTGRR